MKHIHSLLLLLSLTLLCGCATTSDTADQPVTTELHAMDTVMTLTAYGDHANAALADATKEIQRLDALLSISNPSSDIKTLNDTKEATLSEDTRKLLARAITLNQDTNGLFEPTIAPLMDAWGFSTKDYHVPDTATIATLLPSMNAQAIQLADNGHCTIPAQTKVDLGGIAKGYTAERVMAILREHQVEHALISLGGNVQTLGSKPDASPWRIGIQDPFAPDQLIAKLQVHERAVVTSGGYLRYFEENGTRYHHIIDPRTGQPAQSGLASVSIVSKDGTLADALSTALFIMGEKDAVSYWRNHRNDFDAILITDDGRVLVTANLANAVELTNGAKAEVIA